MKFSQHSITSVLVVSLCSSWMIGCASDQEIQVQNKKLRTDEYTYDIGVVAVGDRETIPIVLQSVGPGGVTIKSITSSDPTHFVVLPSWANKDSDGDGVADSLYLQRGSESNPTQDIVEINFRPDDNGLFRTQLTILSDDNTTKERTDTDDGIIRVVVRGVGRVPCANVYPTFLDFGRRPAGGYFSKTINIHNCGEAPLTISSFQVQGSSSFYGASATPIYIFTGQKNTAEIAWIPGSLDEETANLSVTINDPNFPNPLLLQGNSCEHTQSTDWDVDGDGWRSCMGDCNDNNANIHPGALDIVNNLDDDCDGTTDNTQDISWDNDGDGVLVEDGDCHDQDGNIFPNAEEIINGIDDDCNGIIDDNTEIYDDDQDGLSELEGDCDDQSANVHHTVEEVVDGIDNNCNGFIDENSNVFDDDQDGYTEEDGDCDDTDPWSWPSGKEDCDGIDNDCDNIIDEGDDDTENGACAYVVERQVIEAPPSGCQTLPWSWKTLGAYTLVWAAALVLRRRKSR